jgi:hypothetical protein
LLPIGQDQEEVSPLGLLPDFSFYLGDTHNLIPHFKARLIQTKFGVIRYLLKLGRWLEDQQRKML